MIEEALSAVYAAAATWRRHWYAAPARARRLHRPVVSIGNLRVGGSGKTPVVACIARLLVEHGERPVILSRGYAREKVSGGVTIVSDRERVMADIAHAGDEPLLLARSLPGVPVLVCADRYRAGAEAEALFEPTVHLLDDGFQHVRLARDIDLVLADEHDLDDKVLPAGRLREPLANAAVAHAVIVPAGRAESARKVSERLHVPQVFRATRQLGSPYRIGPGQVPPAPARVFAIAGIARPERFFDDLHAAGYAVAGTMAFRDHHRFSPNDVARIVAAARAADAVVVATTEKDAVRLEQIDLHGVPFAAMPLLTRIEPVDVFPSWLLARLAGARAGQA